MINQRTRVENFAADLRMIAKAKIADICVDVAAQKLKMTRESVLDQLQEPVWSIGSAMYIADALNLTIFDIFSKNLESYIKLNFE